MLCKGSKVFIACEERRLYMSKAQPGHALEGFANLPTWDWPDDAMERIHEGLQSSDVPTQCLAAQMAGKIPGHDLALELIRVLKTADDTDLLVETSIALGPVLEEALLGSFGDEDLEPEITPHLVHEIQSLFRRLYHDADAPNVVRRRVLEASVRSPEPWHVGATRAAFQSGDLGWRVTAVFAMGYLDGFETQIVASLDDEDTEIIRESIRSAARRRIQESGPRVLAIIQENDQDNQLRLIGVDALAQLRPSGAVAFLQSLTDHKDDALASAAHVALDETLMWEDIEGLDDL
jgi:hypothetical protein